MTKEELIQWVALRYSTDAEYPWEDENFIFRHTGNRKWFAVAMCIPYRRLGIDREGTVDIVDVKCGPLLMDAYRKLPGILPGYHMNKGSWITILLDGSVNLQEVCNMIDASFEMTASAKKKQKFRQPKEWIIPANPKYYDIEHAFDDAKIIDWKQGAGIIKGDTVYMYVGSPVSAILYKCKVIETDIPYEYEDKNLTIKALMKIQLQKRYKPDKFTFDLLKSEYGIYAVRGPRGIPNSLSAALK